MKSVVVADLFTKVQWVTDKRRNFDPHFGHKKSAFLIIFMHPLFNVADLIYGQNRTINSLSPP